MRKPEEKSAEEPRRRHTWLLAVFVLVSVTVLVLLQSSNVWKDLTVASATDTVLLYALSSLNFFALIVVSFIFLRSLLKLRQERRALQLGSKIKTRLLLYFFLVTLLPLIAMAAFSYLFLNRALERWFSQMPENVLREAQAVQNRAIEDQRVKLIASARIVSSVIGDGTPDEAALGKILEAGDLSALAVYAADGRAISSVRKEFDAERNSELDQMLELAKRGGASADVLMDGVGFEAAVVDKQDGRRVIVVPAYIPMANASEIVDDSLREFDRLKSRQMFVRQLGLTTLGLLTFVLIFVSSWIAFYVAKGLTKPIRALAEGAHEIAGGNLNHRVETNAEDELELLVSAFNDMSDKLESNAAELERRRRYIETVVQSLSTGVISFDEERRVTTINAAAVKMLRLEASDFRGLPLEAVVGEENLKVFERLLGRAERTGASSEHTEMITADGNGGAEAAGLSVALTASALPGGAGTVVVIEDLSELLAAQRAAAWQEVARRMAHEIKNPLTPIQLSAERIAKRLEAETNGNEDRRATSTVVRDGTETILREVMSLKLMVDEFSKFAKLPDPDPEPDSINDVIEQVAALYSGRDDGLEIDLALADDIPEVNLDREQMKRVFVNLIDNALDAMCDSDSKKITVRTRFDKARELVIAELSDSGPGIMPADMQKLFQPYFSTKGHGTGLGLAIVQRIVQEHKGKIIASGNIPRGAKFLIELPPAEQEVLAGPRNGKKGADGSK